MITEVKLSKLKLPKINTGDGFIPFWTLISIWSISTVTSLPGLAVTPILGHLDKIFPHVSDLEIQMLSSLPNLLIIPFVLLSGKISDSKGKLPMLILGLALFLLCGILYFFAYSMNSLIIISCFLGIGAGLIIPLSTGLIADFFVGERRTKQMGLSSGINNLTLVLATLITGSLAKYNWHLPFSVYLIPAISLALCYFLSPQYLKKVKSEQTIKIPGQGTTTQTTNQPSENSRDKALIHIKSGNGMNTKLLSGLIFLYFMVTCITILVTFNISFILQEYNLSSTYSGTIISIYFLGVMIPGFCVTALVKSLKNHIIYVSLLGITLGFLFFLFFKSIYLIGIGAIIMGFCYGILQPLIYDKTSLVANSKRIIFALACVMVGNYLAIILCPFIADFFQTIFHQKHNMLFPFWVNMVISLIFTVIAFLKRKSFLFSAESSMYQN